MNTSSLLGNLYPAGPTAVPPNLTAASATYKQRAWLAMAGLGLFVLLYFALSGWFAWTAWRLLSGLAGGNFSIWGALAGACAAFLAIFMLKALFFVKHAYDIEDIEITREQQPRLFEFIDRIADEAQAPRAHKVYLSPRVNAAVFYDLSLVNLFIPSKKNLEIGLGLVNVVTLGELKAVLAHEFGHFAQRSMAVGRWVYIAQQIAGHIIAKRDILDRFLQQLSQLDLRIAWIGWLLSLVVWSIRSLMEIVFRGVLIAQRALSRQMEFQADLVAVSLTGSDALIHALHKLGAADEAWDRTLSFADSEARAGRATQDLFAVQARVIERVRDILNQPDYGSAPPMPARDRAQHRVFKAQLAQPPRMWSTHPPNEEREQNAKQRYVEAPIDGRSAWDLFNDPAALRTQMSAHLLRKTEAKPVDMAESMKSLDKQYDRPYLNRAYRGAYLGRSIVRHAKTPADLYSATLTGDALHKALDGLYPESLGTQIEQLTELQEEKAALEALRDQVATAPGGIVRHRGAEIKRTDLPAAIAGIEREIADLSKSIEGHDKRCRRVHLALAEGFGKGWPEYLRGVLAVLHYVDHNEADLRDAHGAFLNVYSVVTADGRVSKKERQRLLDAANELYRVLSRIHAQGDKVVLDRTLLRRLETESWSAALGKFDLPPPNDAQLGDWLGVIDSWVGAALGALGALHTCALEQLLLSEAQIAKFHRDGLKPMDAPPASTVPTDYPALLPGTERPRQTRLGWWDKFQTADGAVATGAKLLVAAAIVGGVLAVGGKVGEATVTVYNGLVREVVVEAAGQQVRLRPNRTTSITVPEEGTLRFVAKTAQGQTIESFDQELHGSFGSYVYNIAGAAPLYSWTAVYGGGEDPPPQMLGAIRWTPSSANHMFEDPPTQVRSKGATTRSVLSSGAQYSPAEQTSMVEDAGQQLQLAYVHARWDDVESPEILTWLSLASNTTRFEKLLAERLQETPSAPALLRMEQDTAGDKKPAVCARHTAMAQKTPDSADWQYAAIRCLPDGQEQRDRFIAAHQQWPKHGWLAMAAAYSLVEQDKLAESVPPFETALKRAPATASFVADELARIRRLTSENGRAANADLAKFAPNLASFIAIENGSAPRDTELNDYHQLAVGKIEAAAERALKPRNRGKSFLFYVAASDRAPAELVKVALSTEVPKDDVFAALAAYGLAVREGYNPDAYAAAFRQQLGPEVTDALLAFLESARTAADPSTVPEPFVANGLRMRGIALSTATVMLGTNTPPAWRDKAKRLLFVGERPYFD